MLSRVLACAAAATLLFLPGPAPADDDPKKDQDKPAVGKPGDKKTADGMLSQWELRRRLQRAIDTKDFQQPMTLKEALGLLYEKAAALYKEDDALPILVDAEAFKSDNPDAPDLYDTQIKFPPFPRRMTIANALRLALSQVATRNATYVVRAGIISVTTAERARPDMLLHEKVLANFDNVPLAEALEELSEQTGVSVVVDTRVADKLKAKVSAGFNHDVTAEAALRLLTDTAGLKVVQIDGAVYVTSAANAQKLAKEQKSRDKERRQRELENPPRPTGGAAAMAP